jgi:uncharacterized membrane protein
VNALQGASLLDRTFVGSFQSIDRAIINPLINVPRNDEIKAATDPDLAAVRQRFDEARWVRWNAVRAVASTAALACLAWGLAEYTP